MIDAQNGKFHLITPPQAIVDNAAFTTTAVDTIGAAYAVIFVLLGATDIALAALKLTECDTSGGSYVDVAGADFSVSPLTLPSATADNTAVGIFVDLRGRKRFLDISITGGDGATGQFVTSWAITSRLSEYPDTATKRGLAQQAII